MLQGGARLCSCAAFEMMRQMLLEGSRTRIAGRLGQRFFGGCAAQHSKGGCGAQADLFVAISQCGGKRRNRCVILYLSKRIDDRTAGKTTTLKMLSGLLHPTSGEASVLGHIPWKRERSFQMRLTMVMGQRTQLWWDLPAWDSFLLNKEIYGIPKAQFNATVQELAQLLEIQDLLEVPVKKLSLGQRMKAELACSLLHRPRVLLLDEPTIGLDVVMQEKVRQFIKEYNHRYQATILLTSHNMDDISELCTRIILINHGRILFDGSITAFQQHYAKASLTEAMRQAFKIPHA